MNLMAVAHCKTFDDFGKGALCAVLAGNERGENG